MSSRFPIPDHWFAVLALVAVAFAVSAADAPSKAASTSETGAKTANATPPPEATENTPTNAAEPLTVPATTLFPGGEKAPPPDPNVKKYEGNAKEIVEGEKLYNWYNCAGCHFHGAGGMGPPFMNGGHWIFGGRLDQIYASIYQGRPTGMPSWGHKIPPEQIWAIAAYVKSLSIPAQRAITGGPPLPPNQPTGQKP